jgi:hypothetical protein
MSGIRERAGGGKLAALGVALVSTLAACTSAAPQGSVARPAAQPAAQTPDRSAGAPDARPDAAYDWHGLVTARFGSVLKDMPVALHEVLLFRDAAHAATEAEEQDCYTTSGPAPSFAGRKLDEYLLCFKHDRLWRIQATVRLSADDAAQVFSQACAAWLRKGAPAAPAERLGTSERLGTDSVCSGRDGDIGFSAQLGSASNAESNPESKSESGDTDVPLSITLYSAADRDAERVNQ